MAADEADKDDIADALERMADGLPAKPPRPLQPAGVTPPPAPAPPPRSAAEFRAPPARPTAPGAPAPATGAAPKPPRPDRPDRPVGPPTAAASPAPDDPMSAIVDDDEVIVPAPTPDVFAPRPAPQKPAGPPGIKGLGFRRTVIPILLTCGVLLIGIGLLKWLGGSESLFSEMALGVSATLCGAGVFLLLVAALNMMQVKAELAAAAAAAATKRGA